ncbi:MAG: MFS transporter [Candidatus Omnitrophica bacterium]|nr:MFS transporter [Candidatus Omnitrophota bacterium]
MKKSTYCILLICAFSAVIGLGIISPFMPAFIEKHGANGFWIGMIFAGFGISRAIIMPLVGRVSDKTGKKVFVSSGLLIFTIISLFYPLARNVYEMTAIRLIHGLAAGLIMPIVMAYVGEIAEKGREGLRMGTLNMVFYIGLATGPFLGGIIGENYGFDAVFHLMGIIGAFTFFIVLFFLPDSKGVLVSDPAEWGFRALMRYNFVKAVLLSALLITLTTAVFISFLPSLATLVDVDPDHIGIIISIGIFLAGVLQVPFGRFSDRLDRAGKFIQIGSGTTIGMTALFAMPFCPGFDALLVAGSLVGLGAAIAVPAISSLSVTIGHKAGMGAWMGIINTARSVGLAITPLLAGIFMDHWGVDTVFYLFGLLALFGLLGLGYFVFKRFRMDIRRA